MDLFGLNAPQVEEDEDSPAPDEPALEPAPRARPDLWPEILAVLCIATFPVMWSYVYGRIAPRPTPTPNLYFISGLVHAVLEGWAVFFIMRRSLTSWTAYGFVRPSLEDLGLGAVLLFLYWGVFVLFRNRRAALDGASVSTTIYPTPTLLGITLMVVGLSAFAFMEEVVFRAYLISRMESATTSTLFAVVTSAGLFAACHAYEGSRGAIQSLIFALVGGAGFVLLRRIWPLVLAHFAWNLLVVLKVPS